MSHNNKNRSFRFCEKFSQNFATRRRKRRNRELSKPWRQRQQERRQTKGLMSKTIVVHVRYKSLYISLPFSAKQQREMTKFCVFWRT